MNSDISTTSPQPVPKKAKRCFFRASASDFKKIPGSPIAYWVSEKVFDSFDRNKLRNAVEGEGKNVTSDNERFVRYFWEVSSPKIGKNLKWLFYAKGGSFRKWYGNMLHVVDWSENARNYYRSYSVARIIPKELWYREGITWTDITSSGTGFRYLPPDTTFDATGLSVFPKISSDIQLFLGLLNSSFSLRILPVLNPTLHAQLIDIKAIPLPQKMPEASSVIEILISISQADWDNFETSWDFQDLPLLRDELKAETLATTWANWDRYCRDNIARMKELEEENNRLWIDAYGLQDELTPEVPEKEITLARADPRKDMAAFISYAIGCMFGRYSLEVPGLVLADAGATVEDYYRIVAERANTVASGQGLGASEDSDKLDSSHQPPTTSHSYLPDPDNIIPVLDGEWFEDDIVARFREFLKVTFGEATLRENLQFIEESLGKDLRKYLVGDFYKDHLQTYKKRPIYWLFQSPKKSFQALIYLHRYNRDTVNLLLSEYLREFQNKLQNRRQHLIEILASESTSARDKTAATKEQAKIEKSLTELADWERDVILPLAQQRLEIDLDDGVKQNYPKFGSALAKIPGVS